MQQAKVGQTGVLSGDKKTVSQERREGDIGSIFSKERETHVWSRERERTHRLVVVNDND